MKFNSFIYFYLLTLLLHSCNSNNQLSEKKFTKVLKDIIVVESYAREVKRVDSSFVDTVFAIAKYKAVFEKNKCTKQAFENTLAYYKNNNKKFSVILDTLNNQFALERNLMYKQMSIPIN